MEMFFANVPGYPPDAATTVTAYPALIFKLTASNRLSIHAYCQIKKVTFQNTIITFARSVSSLRRGRTVSVSGSPNRTLYSNTFGPLDVNIRPVNNRPT